DPGAGRRADRARGREEPLPRLHLARHRRRPPLSARLPAAVRDGDAPLEPRARGGERGGTMTEGHADEPRIRPGTPREIGLVNAAIARLIGVASGGKSPNVFTTLARHRGLFRRWLVFASGLMPGGKLRRAETELVILHVAREMGCEYEWDHH